MMYQTETDLVALNLQRAYRDAENSNLPPGMQELLEKLRQQDEEEDADDD
jgi:hypothetical protein